MDNIEESLGEFRFLNSVCFGILLQVTVEEEIWKTWELYRPKIYLAMVMTVWRDSGMEGYAGGWCEG